MQTPGRVDVEARAGAAGHNGRNGASGPDGPGGLGGRNRECTFYDFEGGHRGAGPAGTALPIRAKGGW